MSDELKQMILRYLADMADRGDYEAKKLFEMISREYEND
tara:strand:+ start:581 stop:697 length:117 start_codon:yes stop_codon:yes gene_type:complete